MRAAWVAGERAVALMLLIGAGLLIQSFIRLNNVTPGFRPDRILSMHIGLSSSRYANERQIAAGLEEIVQRLQQRPGASSVCSIQFPPFSGLPPPPAHWVAGAPLPTP